MKVKVYNMTSPNGNKVANQFEIYTSKGKYFQSYNSIIAFGIGTVLGMYITSQIDNKIK